MQITKDGCSRNLETYTIEMNNIFLQVAFRGRTSVTELNFQEKPQTTEWNSDTPTEEDKIHSTTNVATYISRDDASFLDRYLKSTAIRLIELRDGIPNQLLKVVGIQTLKGVNVCNFEYTRQEVLVNIGLKGGLLGGKGGFGAALRASGKSGGKATQNFGACRDLNGRRLRHVNNEIRLRLWRQQQDVKRRALEQGKKFNDEELSKFDKETESGIEGWHLDLPVWAEGIKKLKNRKSNKKSRLCTYWVKSRYVLSLKTIYSFGLR